MSHAPSQRREALDATAIGLLVGCCLLWGLNQVAVKVALPQVPPFAQVALRSAIALLLLVALARWRGIQLWSTTTAPAGGLAGALFAAEFACIYAGLQYTTASRMTVFLYTSPFVVALAMPLINPAERLSKSQWLGLAIAFSGVAAAFWEGLSAPVLGPQQWWGDALGVAAALLWAATTVVIRASRLASAPAEQTLAYQLLASVVLVGMAAAAWEGNTLNSGSAWPFWPSLSPLTLASLLFQGIVICFASYLTWFWLLARYPASRLATFTLLTPIAGLMMGVLLLDEPLSMRLLGALLAVVSGIVLVNRR